MTLSIKSSKVPQVVGLVLTVLFCAIAFAIYHHSPPNPHSTDGVYGNPCCKKIVLDNGTFTYDGHMARVKLIHDKFGLEGYLDRPIGPFYRNEDGAEVPVVLVFENNGFTVIDRTGKEWAFERIEDPTRLR